MHYNFDVKCQGSGDTKLLMMILSSEAEILVEAGPVVQTNEEDKEIDPAIAALSEEEAAAVFEGQVNVQT